jgi:hypothetical protein
MTPRRSLLVLVLISFLPAVRLQAGCSPTVAVQVPATACKSGTATAAVMAIPGATYAWTVDGGQIGGDASGDHIAITLGTSAKATASVTLTSGDCVSYGSGVIALHDPFGVQVVPIAAGRAGEPLTIIWNYANGTPGQQTISGDFGTVALAADVRNYTYSPQHSGSKQFVIDASMKLPAFTAPPPSRQRAVAKSPVSASPCTVVHAAAAYTVGECVIPAVVIAAPASVTTDTKFDLSVGHQAGAVATWTITNGFPTTATGENVTITAGSTGQVGVSVRLTRGACTDSTDRSIAITPKPACANPKATVSASPASCGSATLNASFTGTPPFKGAWSDNVPFETKSTSLVRTITIPGNYSIIRFQDAICEGTASGVAVVPALYPSATIVGKGNSCTEVDTATVYFSGKPPYAGCWLDGTCFQTSQATLTKPITKAGWISLASGSDGTGCPFAIFGGVQAFESPHVGLSRRCDWTPDFGNYANFFLFYAGTTTGPNITWSDGVKTGQARLGIKPSETTTYTVASISEGVCPAIWDTPRSITISPTPVPEFAPDSDDLCFGTLYTATLTTPPPPGTKVEWSVPAGTLISGQGTNSIQYQAGIYDNGHPTISTSVISTFIFADADRCPLTSRRPHRVVPVEPYGSLNLQTGAEFHAGKTSYFTFEVGWDITDWSVTNSMNDTITVPAVCASSDYCTATYTSTHGPGKSTVTLHAKNACKTKDFSAEITIVP